MTSISVTTTPVSVRGALALPDHPGGVVWLGTAQNIDAEQTVYRIRSVAAPDPASAHAFRHPTGDRWAMTVYGDDLGATWLWTAEGTAAVVLESGLPGV